MEKLQRERDELRDAVRAYRDAKGRYHTQKACERLLALLPENAKGDAPRMTPIQQPISSTSDAMPCSLSDFVRVINTASTDWVTEKIHPYVPRSPKDTNASYLRKMALWAQATDTYPANDASHRSLPGSEAGQQGKETNQ